jgi:hypothetical protein
MRSFESTNSDGSGYLNRVSVSISDCGCRSSNRSVDSDERNVLHLTDFANILVVRYGMFARISDCCVLILDNKGACFYGTVPYETTVCIMHSVVLYGK